MIPKFRYWDGQEKVMEPVDNMSFCDNGEILLYIDCEEWALGPDLILMQSTGLKDKNGVEIFEGDILKNIHNGKIRKVCWNHSNVCFQLSEVGHESIRTEYWKLSNPKWSYEIIGNIYANPELLSLGIE